ncbi:LCP family protein [Pseudalkalibacillus berkeleyi]|uniref:Regulatory protein MsrR n=1 Tax=Pseudalkalibacillus berkeleyi TaxID=1069813 RepID=A0ABS9H421_9BACL|nr:LCP family protein [Pseudalkalibacillus berkeleyi]MCF6138674.1 LCP family protein [Pseudalkalibacillus berkeleyi]
MPSRIDRKKQKKKGGFLKKTLLFLVILFIAVAGYAAIQYYLGLQQADPSKEMDNNYEFNAPEVKGKYNVLLLGVDAREEDESSRTDTIMIAQYDTDENKAKLVSIMRDSYVEIPGYKNNKINAAFFHGGPELLRQTIKENFDIDIHYYALVDFKGFEQIVDTIAPDGIEMDVEKRMSTNIGVTLQPGVQRLNGKELLGYARFRHDARGDYARVERQQKVVSKVKDEFTSLYGISKLPKVIGTIQPYIDTNMKSFTAIGLAKDVILNKGDIETMKIPVEGGFEETSNSAGSILQLDFEKNSQALKDFLGFDVDTTTITENNNTDEEETEES